MSAYSLQAHRGGEGALFCPADVPDPGLIHHSDHGSQYASVEFGKRIKEAGLLPSMGSVFRCLG